MLRFLIGSGRYCNIDAGEGREWFSRRFRRIAFEGWMVLRGGDHSIRLRILSCDLVTRRSSGTATGEWYESEGKYREDGPRNHSGTGTSLGFAVQLKPANCFIILPFPRSPAEQFRSLLMQLSIHILMMVLSHAPNQSA